MSDMAVLADDGVGAGKAVHDAASWTFAPARTSMPSEVAAQARAWADIAAGPDDHVADQHGARMHEGGRIDDGRDAVDRIDGQCPSSSSLSWRRQLEHHVARCRTSGYHGDVSPHVVGMP